MKPEIKPQNPNFSSGPCAKYPGFTLDLLKGAPLGRSHRSSLGKAKLKEAIDKTKEVLELPQDYLVGLVPGSDTGAIEMAMWNLLGERGVDVVYFESFGKQWANDIKNQLKIADVQVWSADYGQLPDLSKVNFDHDVVFTWNGTTSGVKVPNGNWIPDTRKGLTICDATSAVFAMEIPWQKIDVATFSWQKVLGGEAAHGMLILSPRAVLRIESYSPPWPMPKVFQLRKSGKLNMEVFEGSPINTPSMLCNEDYLEALNWAKSVGGLKGLVERSNANLQVIEDFVAKQDWIEFLAADKAFRSNTSVCLKVNLDADKLKKLVQLLAGERVAYDCASYREAPAGLRFWCGATLDKKDLEIVTQWLEWAYQEVK
ncbi:MAG: phosphoserine aminotransferase [Acidobacteria bacterium]|nr:phosphoserine aminotransferase [Acidobacteriota bacterium]